MIREVGPSSSVAVGVSTIDVSKSRQGSDILLSIG